MIAELRARLDNPADPLQRWLQQSQPLCQAIMGGALPADNLMIDVFGLKQPKSLSDADYNMYTSRDPRPKRALPRRRGTAGSA
jgi:hypothetical protein